MSFVKSLTAILVLGMATVLTAAIPASATTNLLVNGAGASVSTLSTTTAASFTYPNEAFKASTFNLFSVNSSVAGTKAIVYIPDFTAVNTDVVFTITNGTFQAADTGARYFLYDSSTGTRATTGAAGSPIGTVTPSTLTFPKISTVATHRYVLVTSGSGTNLNFTTVSATTPTAATITAAQGIYNNASATLLQYSNYWLPTVTTKASGVIDVAVASGRKKFSTSGGHSATVENIVVTFAADGTKHFVASVNSGGLPAAVQNTTAFSSESFSLNVNDITGIASVSFLPQGGTLQTLTYDSANKRYAATFNTANEPLNPETFTFTITVNGTTVLNTRSFTATVLANGLTGFPATTSYLDNADAGSWTLNGYQALCPYVSTNSAFGSQFVLNNASSTAVDVYWDTVTSSSSTVQANLANYSNKQVTGKTQIPAYGTQIFTAEEVIAALGLPTQDGGSYLRNQVRVTVTGAPSLVTGQAIQSDGGEGKRTQPLLIDNNISGNPTTNQGYKTN